jgi:hypothetical protein
MTIRFQAALLLSSFLFLQPVLAALSGVIDITKAGVAANFRSLK